MLRIPLPTTVRSLARVPARALFAAICGGLVLNPLRAHDVWVERVLLIQFGEIGDRLDPYKPEKVTKVTAYGAGGAEIAAEVMKIGDTGAVIHPAAAPVAVAVEWNGGYRVQDGEAWKPATEEQAKAAPAARQGFFCSKTVLAWDARLAEPLGAAVEIVPLADPLAGAAVRVRVLVDGKPAAGIEVERNGEACGATDAEGIATVPAAIGTQVVHAKAKSEQGTISVTRSAVLSYTTAAAKP